jgi:hydroxymethylpyrimidine/phosphomethylpyrimidine kinase
VKTPRVLIVAGSDSGGGAGIQADIKTVTMLGGHAMTAITALTAQNTLGVTGVMAVPAEFVLAQMDAVLGDLGADVVKIGMIGSAATAHAVADRLQALVSPPSSRRRPGSQDQTSRPSPRDPGLRRDDGRGDQARAIPIVFDPVMIATSGSVLADAETIAAFERLMGPASLITPNAPELAALTGREIATVADLAAAAEALAARTGSAVMAKGGHLEGETLTDLLVGPDGATRRFEDTRIETAHTHGTGCTLASAIAVGLGAGQSLAEAVQAARLFVRLSLREAPGFGSGHGPMGQQAVRLDLPDRAGPTLNQLTLPASDYDASVRFYERLGCRLIVAAPPRYARFEVPGGVTLSIEVKDAPPSSTEHFFQCADVDAEVARLAAAGFAFDVMPEDRDYLWRVAETSDPHGNRICLYSTGDNRRFPPWRQSRG